MPGYTVEEWDLWADEVDAKLLFLKTVMEANTNSSEPLENIRGQFQEFAKEQKERSKEEQEKFVEHLNKKVGELDAYIVFKMQEEKKKLSKD